MNRLETQHINLLLIEENQRDLTPLYGGLERFGYQHIETARDAAQAKQKLDEKLFDIIVADMRLDGDDDGGFAVLSEVKKRHITSVLIILTANDTVADSRKAFKEGAWDYISKNMEGNVFEELDKSIQEAISYLNKRWHDKDIEWIEDNITQLVAGYGGQHIAVMNNRVILSAETEDNLKEQLREKNYPFYMPIIKKIELPTNAKPSIEELIKEGQNQRVEFKPTLGWDVKRQKVNQKLRFAILETITAFMNSEGGYLVIGVAEDGAILGLESELAGQTPEQLKQTLESRINNRIGAAFSRVRNVRFKEIEGKYVYTVDVDKAPGPVFMNGLRGIEFYIRSDQKTIPVSDAQEIATYIEQHWR